MGGSAALAEDAAAPISMLPDTASSMCRRVRSISVRGPAAPDMGAGCERACAWQAQGHHRRGVAGSPQRPIRCGHDGAATAPTLWLGIAGLLLCVAAAGLEGLSPHDPAARQGVARLLRLLLLQLLPLKTVHRACARLHCRGFRSRWTSARDTTVLMGETAEAGGAAGVAVPRSTEATNSRLSAGGGAGAGSADSGALC
jgi:hypothetical protein